MWFNQLASVPDPGSDELERFVDAVVQFLDFAISDPDLQYLWADDPGLDTLARNTFDLDVRPAAESLKQAIPRTPAQQLVDHGLIGRPMQFKLRVMDAVGKRWDQVKGTIGVREWFRKIVEAIDAALGSLIDATGAGGLIKEFKDALLALG